LNAKMKIQQKLEPNKSLNQITIDTNQEEDKSPVVKASKIIEFSGKNWADISNTENINLNSFTISLWFNTNMYPTEETFLLNKGIKGIDSNGKNLNFGLYFAQTQQISGGFETSSGDDYIITSPKSYNDGNWHHIVLTFNDLSNTLKLYIDGIEVANSIINPEVKPDTTGNTPIRLGANSLSEENEDENAIGGFIGQLDDIQIWDYVFTKDQVASLFDLESKMKIAKDLTSPLSSSQLQQQESTEQFSDGQKQDSLQQQSPSLQSKSKFSTTTTNLEPNFEIYENTTFGITIEYPINAKITEKNNNIAFTLPQSSSTVSSPRSYVIITVSDLQRPMSLDQYTNITIAALGQTRSGFNIIGEKDQQDGITLSNNPAHAIIFTDKGQQSQNANRQDQRQCRYGLLLGVNHTI
jgi:hypothetical protein